MHDPLLWAPTLVTLLAMAAVYGRLSERIIMLTEEVRHLRTDREQRAAATALSEARLARIETASDETRRRLSVVERVHEAERTGQHSRAKAPDTDD